jgi:hypothetical protein
MAGDDQVPVSRTKQAAGLAVLLVISFGVAAAGVAVIWQRNAAPPGPADPAVTKTAVRPSLPDNADGDDRRLRRQVVGTWQDEYQGKRTLTLRADGTGTMVVELNGLRAALVAPRLEFNIAWSVAHGRLKKHSLGGKPAAQVGMILKTMGDTVDEPILELTGSRLRLLDQDGKTKYDWRRMP